MAQYQKLVAVVKPFKPFDRFLHKLGAADFVIKKLGRRYAKILTDCPTGAVAVLSVISGMIPYLAVAGMVTAMIEHQKKEMSFYLLWCAVAAGGYILKGVFNGISTSVSHTATYLTMKEIRQKLVAKLTRMPMGTILESSSGYYKDVIVDRVEGIEVPLAHLLP